MDDSKYNGIYDYGIGEEQGEAGIVDRGKFSISECYKNPDCVKYNGDTYVCIKDSIGNLPTNKEFWISIKETLKEFVV